ncbi:MAG TPA: hypothetical protein PLL10_06505, partial [Elusimicrobiales bacterium]|nr:hypothetical protein [Elusimicrobiales bacterium]
GLYFSNPLYYLPRMEESSLLKELRRSFIIIAHGTGPWETFNSQAHELARLLGTKGIPNYYDVWGPEYAHEWYTWKEMIVKFLNMLSDGVCIADKEVRLIGPQRRIFKQKPSV